MKKPVIQFVTITCLGAVQLLGGMLLTRVAIAAPEAVQPSPTAPPATLPDSLQRLTQMFSPNIQTIVNACWEKGRANLEAGAAPQGELMCGDGSVATGVAYSDYLTTVSDILAASSLVGFRAVVEANPRVDPQALATFLSNPQGSEMLRQAVESAVIQSQLVTAESDVSSTLLTNEVVSRVVPALQDSTRLSTLLGNPDEYTQVVENFCTAPGMSVEEAQALTPELDPVQLYAICIQESGAADEILQMVNQ